MYIQKQYALTNYYVTIAHDWPIESVFRSLIKMGYYEIIIHCT